MSDFDLYITISAEGEIIFGNIKLILFFVLLSKYKKHPSEFGPTANIFSSFTKVGRKFPSRQVCDNERGNNIKIKKFLIKAIFKPIKI